MSKSTSRSSLSPEQFREAIEAIALRSAEELAASQMRLLNLRPR